MHDPSTLLQYRTTFFVIYYESRRDFLGIEFWCLHIHGNTWKLWNFKFPVSQVFFLYIHRLRFWFPIYNTAWKLHTHKANQFFISLYFYVSNIFHYLVRFPLLFLISLFDYWYEFWFSCAQTRLLEYICPIIMWAPKNTSQRSTSKVRAGLPTILVVSQYFSISPSSLPTIYTCILSPTSQHSPNIPMHIFPSQMFPHNDFYPMSILIQSISIQNSY